MATFSHPGIQQQQKYSTPFPSVPPHQQPSFTSGTGYHHSPLVGGSSPTQMETSSYLPAYLLGGPSSPSRSPQRQRPTHFYQSPQTMHMPSPSHMTSAMGSAHTNRYSTAERQTTRKHEVKPGGPPIQGLHEHISSPIKPHPPSGSISSPERRQLTYTKTKPHFHTTGTPSFLHSPALSTAEVSGLSESGVTHPSLPFPSQMDPFYTQGEELTSEATYDEHWVTVFGFPPTSTTYILEQFSQYGTIISHKISTEGSNWMHLQYQTKLQAKKALSKNGRIYGDGIMVGVQSCIDKSVVNGDCSVAPPITGTPNYALPQSILNKKPSTMRPLTAAYQASSSAHEVAPANNPNTPQKSSGFFSRTLEYVFGW